MTTTTPQTIPELIACADKAERQADHHHRLASMYRDQADALRTLAAQETAATEAPAPAWGELNLDTTSQPWPGVSTADPGVEPDRE